MSNDLFPFTDLMIRVAPEQFEFINPEDDQIEAIFCKKYLFLRADRESLIQAIVEEAKEIMGPRCMITGTCEITVSIKRNL